RNQVTECAAAGRPEDVGQGQEGSACRSQRGAEAAAAGDREQGQYRPRRQVLRQAVGCARRRSELTPFRYQFDRRIKKEAPEKISGAFSLAMRSDQVRVRIRIMKLS